MASRKSKVFSLTIAQGVLVLANVGAGMVFARVLTVADYGTYLQTFLAYDFAVPLLTAGLPSALFYFLPSSEKRQKGLVLDNLTLLFLAGLIFSSFLLLGGTELLARRFDNPDLSKTLQWMVLYPLYTFPVLLASAVWVTKNKVKLNSVFNIVRGLTLAFLLIIAAWLSEGFMAPTMVRIFLPLAFLPVALYFVFKEVPGDWDLPRLSSMWEMAKFSIPLGLATVFGTLTIQLASIVVSMLTSPQDFAIYANGAKEVPIIGIITGSISVVIMADMAKRIKEGDKQSALDLFRKSAAISATFLLPVMIFLLIYAENFIQVLYSNKYSESVLPFRIYLFMLPVRIVFYGAAFIALGRTKALLYRSLISLVLTAIFAYFMTQWIGYIGAAIATVIVSYIWAIPYNLFTLAKGFESKPLNIIPFKRLGLILFIALISGFPAALFTFFDLPYLISMAGGFFIFGGFYLSLGFRYLPELRNLIKPLKQIIKFLP